MARNRYRRRRLRVKAVQAKKALLDIRQTTASSFHFQRAQAQLIMDEGVGRPKKISHAIVVLNEVTPGGALLFSEVPFDREQLLTLNIPQIRNFYVKCRVEKCVEIGLNPGVLSQRKYPYRMELSYEFRSEDERKAVQAFCDFLASQFLAAA